MAPELKLGEWCHFVQLAIAKGLTKTIVRKIVNTKNFRFHEKQVYFQLKFQILAIKLFFLFSGMLAYDQKVLQPSACCMNLTLAIYRRSVVRQGEEVLNAVEHALLTALDEAPQG